MIWLVSHGSWCVMFTFLVAEIQMRLALKPGLRFGLMWWSRDLVWFCWFVAHVGAMALNGFFSTLFLLTFSF